MTDQGIELFLLSINSIGNGLKKKESLQTF